MTNSFENKAKSGRMYQTIDESSRLINSAADSAACPNTSPIIMMTTISVRLEATLSVFAKKVEVRPRPSLKADPLYLVRE